MLKKLFRLLWKGVLLFILFSLLWVVAYRYLDVAFTPLMGIRALEDRENHDLKHQWVPLSQISEELQLAIICAEDQNFFHHNGFDYKAIEKAYRDNKKGKKLKGGSTISQQTAKNVFLWPERSWFRKGLEAYFTFLIETIWSKDRILETYLNSIELGPGVYGVEAASEFWFNTNANKISRHQAAALATILPSPRAYNPKVRTPYLERRKQWILRQINNYGSLENVKN